MLITKKAHKTKEHEKKVHWVNMQQEELRGEKCVGLMVTACARLRIELSGFDPRPEKLRCVLGKDT